jgi:histidinol-phosphate aminotransferase
VLRTFSKAYGLAGMRLGYALAHAAVIRLLNRVKVPWNLSAITLAAASAALDDVAEFEARTAEIRAARSELALSLSRIPGLTAMPSEGNFILVDISATGASAEQFVQAVFEEGVLIRSLRVHHATRSYVRVTIGTLDQNAACQRAFERAAARFNERRPRLQPAYLSLSGDAE